jgi:hypothetical protein
MCPLAPVLSPFPPFLPDIIPVPLIMTYHFTEMLSSENVTDAKFKIWHRVPTEFNNFTSQETWSLIWKSSFFHPFPWLPFRPLFYICHLSPLCSSLPGASESWQSAMTCKSGAKRVIFLQREGSQGLNTERHDCSEDQTPLHTEYSSSSLKLFVNLHHHCQST